MNIAFYRPDGSKGTGGLDAAIDSLSLHLLEAGCQVTSIQSPVATPVQDADIHHFHGLWLPWHSQIANQLKTAGKPYLVSTHGMLEPWAWRHKLWKKLPYYVLREQRYLSNAAGLLATAPPEADNLKDRFPQQCIHTIPLGLTGTARPDYESARSNLGITGEISTLLYFSRLHVKKGADLLLKAIADMNLKKFCRLLVVGDGEPDYVNRLHEFAAEHASVLPEISWLGPKWGDEKWQYLQAADLFCLPTHSENFGLAVLEALQVGTRVMTTHGTPWPRLISDQQAAIFVDPEVQAIQQGLMRFIRNREWSTKQRQRLADWAHSSFAWQPIIAAYLDAYRKSLELTGKH